MKGFINENNKKYDAVFIWMTIAILLRLIVYFAIAIEGIGTVPFKSYFGLFINVFMYVSLFTYMVNVFKFGKQVSPEAILMRFSISTCIFAMSAKDEETIIFVLTLIMLLITPYAAATLSHSSPKKSLFLMTVIFILSIAVTIAKIVFPIDNFIYGLNKKLYYLDCCNVFIECSLFYALTLLHYLLLSEEKKKAA